MWLAAEGGGGNIWVTLMPFIAMFAIFYFLLIRPQQKKNKERINMLNSLKKGDKVTTIGGLHGTIDSITDDKVVLKVNDVTKLTFERSAIGGVVARAADSSGSTENA